MSTKFLFPNWNKLSKEDQDLFEEWLQSLVYFLTSHAKLKKAFTARNQLLDNDDGGIENPFLKIQKPIKLEFFDAADTTDGLSIKDLIQVTKKTIPDKLVGELICSAICLRDRNSQSCKDCNKRFNSGDQKTIPDRLVDELVCSVICLADRNSQSCKDCSKD